MNWLSGGMVLGTVTSQVLLDLCVILSWLYLLYSKYRERSKGTPPTLPFFSRIGIEWAFLGYFVVAALSIAINAPEPKPWLYSMRKFTWMAEIYLMVWLFSQLKISERKWLLYFSLAFLLPNLYAIAGVLIGYDPITGGNTVRAIGLVNSATYHAHGNGAIFVFFLTLALMAFPRLSSPMRVMVFFGLLLMGTSIFLTYTRGIWISVTLATFFLLLVYNWRWALGAAGAYAGASATLFLTSSSFQKRILMFFQGNHADQVRKDLYEAFWLMFKDHPLIGVGYWDQYRRIVDYWPRLNLPPDHFISHAHNQYLNVLATTGLLGLFFFMAIIGYFLKLNVSLLIKHKEPLRRALLLACLVLQVEYLLACVTDVTFEYAKLRAILVMTWALLIAIRSGRIGFEESTVSTKGS